MTTDIATRQDDQLAVELFGRREDFQRALGAALEADKFLADALTAIGANPKLRSCTPESLLGALYLAAQLGLPVGGPLQQFHLTIRNVYNYDERRSIPTVVPIIGYPGLIKLAMNSGEYDTIGGIVVYENDEFEKPWADETGKHFKHREADDDRGAIIGVIGYATVKGSDRSEITWTTYEDVIASHRPTQWEKTPWADKEHQMVQKTGARVVTKYTAKSTAQEKFALALVADSAVVRKVDDRDGLEIEHTEEGPSEDWPTLIKGTDDKKDLAELFERIKASGEMTAELNAQILAHAGTLTKDSRAVDEQPPAAEQAAKAVGRELTEEEFEAASAAEYEAHLAAQGGGPGE